MKSERKFPLIFVAIYPSYTYSNIYFGTFIKKGVEISSYNSKKISENFLFDPMKVSNIKMSQKVAKKVSPNKSVPGLGESDNRMPDKQ